MKRIAIFASGSGTNAEKIIYYFKNNDTIKVAVVFTNNANAGVAEVARNNNIPVEIIEKESFFETDIVLKRLNSYNIDLIVLAGFLWMIPGNIIVAFKDKIINIHPALLPKYGGKGMYGVNVHKAVMAAGEKRTGISIHYVNEHYDEGEIVFQAVCEIETIDTAETIAKKVQLLEHLHFSKIIEEILTASVKKNIK